MAKTRGLVSMVRNRMQRKSLYSSADYWNAKAEENGDRSASMWPNDHLNVHLHREQTKVIEELLPNMAGMRVLDVGCGTGRMSRYFASRGAEVVGFDFSEKAIEVAKTIESKRKTESVTPQQAGGTVSSVSPTFEVRSVFEIDYPPQFDLAFSWGVLTIACREREDLQKALGQVAAGLKPGGRMLFLEPIHRGMLHRVLRLSLTDFIQEVKATGCNILSVRGLHYWPARVLLAYAPWPRWLTDPVYRVGQKFLSGPAWGDYKLVFAEKRKFGE